MGDEIRARAIVEILQQGAEERSARERHDDERRSPERPHRQEEADDEDAGDRQDRVPAHGREVPDRLLQPGRSQRVGRIVGCAEEAQEGAVEGGRVAVRHCAGDAEEGEGPARREAEGGHDADVAAQACEAVRHRPAREPHRPSALDPVAHRVAIREQARRPMEPRRRATVFATAKPSTSTACARTTTNPVGWWARSSQAP
ncbi:MAG: hypothetical protein ACK5YI_03015 [Rhodospirillales bacterium]